MAAAPSVPVEGGDALDRDEFTSFYASSFPRLVGQLYAMTGDQAEAQDVVEEAFVRAWARRGKIDRAQAPEAWVRVTAWRIAASRWRCARHGARLSLLTARPESIEGPDPGRVAFVDALRKLPTEQCQEYSGGEGQAQNVLTGQDPLRVGFTVHPSAIPSGAGVQIVANSNVGYYPQPVEPMALFEWLVQASPQCTGS